MNDVILSLSLLNHIYSGQREENIMYTESVPVLSSHSRRGGGGGSPHSTKSLLSV